MPGPKKSQPALLDTLASGDPVSIAKNTLFNRSTEERIKPSLLNYQALFMPPHRSTIMRAAVKQLLIYQQIVLFDC